MPKLEYSLPPPQLPYSTPPSSLVSVFAVPPIVLLLVSYLFISKMHKHTHTHICLCIICRLIDSVVSNSLQPHEL